ncbi:aminotransferase class V-fold PLP-dependent enzyme [Streptomyces sp. VRA16 Mangrove soil]|uniref:aminotransferase class V-fold PLP-dependent enzyme n=1 Tax=Streptomyces sp. VRA16 Mangrove soil TaxID=2817434 RepID=UPI001A9DA207|nr:aminotransferase class V-fold PLP-dependent enzyme [Streptomyces sp. VRA16 Mangrove soil]MBO1335238.1 aminotransferase class V-fold PLP-dependent enzyme [Streptomyces sp. VRA16 Mangrove soil]
MELDLDLVRAQYRPAVTYLNTASSGLLPERAASAMRDAITAMTEGRPIDSLFTDVEEARAAFARLAGVPVARVATGSSVAVHTGLIAASLPDGAEVLVAEGEFSSTINPFHVRGNLKVRTVPLEALAESVRPGTALVAVSAAQSADGRVTDLTELRAVTRAHGARLYVDASQAAGWFPLAEHAAAADYVSSVAFKWLTCPRGAAFFIGPDDPDELTPVFAGWVAGEKPWDSCYGPVTEPARSARRFDETPGLIAFAGARRSLALVEELGVDAIRAHDLALADRFRAGLAGLGREPVPSPGSPIVSVPGLGVRQGELHAAGIELSNRAGNLRASFHLYNTVDDVDRLLDALSG